MNKFTKITIRFFRDVFLGLKSYFQAFIFVIKHEPLQIFFLAPILITIFIFWGQDYLTTELQKTNFENKINYSQLQYGDNLFNALIHGIKLILLFIIIKLDKNIILIALVPRLTMVSVKTEYLLTGNTYPFNLKQLLKDIRRGANIAATNMIIMMLVIAAWYILTLVISPLERISSFVIFCIGFYFYGFSFMDYVNERRRLDINESMEFIRKHFGVAFALGGIFALIYKEVPFVGVVIGPITGVVASTIALHKIVNLKKNKYAIKEQKGNTRKAVK